MNTYGQLERENQGRAASARSPKDTVSQPSFSVVEERPETTAQRKLDASLNQSASVRSQLQLQEALNQSPRVVAQAKLAQTLSERQSTPHPQQAVQRRQALDEDELLSDRLNVDAMPSERMYEEEPLQGKLSAPIQRKENRTGLPDHLKAGIETLSGLPMDDVAVEYNSPEPARVDALATTQGKQIKLGPGQEQHLKHEAWHLVQQEQGRVKPTTQLRGVAINDDSALEREADVMGARANQIGHSALQRMEEDGSGPLTAEGFSGRVTQRRDTSDGKTKSDSHSHAGAVECGHAACSSRSSTVQRKLTKITAEDVDSPAGALKDALGVPVKNMLLPGTQPAGQVERAKAVEAIVEKKTLRKDERKKSPNLTKITTMARAEQALLQGADIKKFYDAGHLVADQLIGNKDDSFVIWNLAPQVSSLNAPTYAQIMEEEVKLAAKGAKIKVKVSVDYPDGGTYKVKVKEIVKRGIVEAKPVDATTVKIGTKNHALEKEISIPRRVPNQWKMKATVDHATKEFQKIKKPAGKDELAEYFVPDLAKAEPPTVGMPFRFTVSDATLAKSQLKVESAQKRVFEARQWGPSSAGVMTADIISLVSNIFRDLESGKAILNKLKGSDILVPQSQQEIILSTIQEVSQPWSELLSFSTELNKVSEERSNITNDLASLALRSIEIMSTVDQPYKLKVFETASKITKIQLGLAPVGDDISKMNLSIGELQKDYSVKLSAHVNAAKMEPELADAMKHIFNVHSAIDDLAEEIDPMKGELLKLQEALKASILEIQTIKEELQKLQEEDQLAKEQQKQVVAPKLEKEEEPTKPFSFFTSDSVSVSFFQPTPQKTGVDIGEFFSSPDLPPTSEKTGDVPKKRRRSLTEKEKSLSGEEQSKGLREKRVRAQESQVVERDFRQISYDREQSFSGGRLIFFWFGVPPVNESDRIILKGNEIVTATKVESRDGVVYVWYRDGV